MGRREVTEKAQGVSITFRFGRSIGRTREEEDGAANAAMAGPCRRSPAGLRSHAGGPNRAGRRDPAPPRRPARYGGIASAPHLMPDGSPEMPVKAVIFDAYGTLLRNEDLMLIPGRSPPAIRPARTA
jgi:hypothetical protein